MTDPKTIYKELMVLVDNPLCKEASSKGDYSSAKNEAFYYKDFSIEDSSYRIFNYRLASYSDFLLPSALECRGIMFEIDKGCNYVNLVCRPMKKFFNISENPFTSDLELSNRTISNIYEKADGSLISTFLHNGELRLKSKMSLEGEQVIDATKWLNLPCNKLFKKALHKLALDNYTVNLEWLSPLNRIVLLYPEPKLVVLNIRHNYTGEHLRILANLNAIIEPYRINEVHCDNLKKFIDDVPAMTDIEGFVIELRSGQRIKLKTLEYLRKHKCKESVDNAKALIENILYESIDDVKSLFVDNSFILNRIKEFENIVIPKYNHIESTVTSFYNGNKELNRKDYAIRGMSELGNLFHLAMAVYVYGSADVKEFCMKYYKDVFSIKEN